ACFRGIVKKVRTPLPCPTNPQPPLFYFCCGAAPPSIQLSSLAAAHSHSPTLLLDLLPCVMARARPSSTLWSLVKTVGAGMLSFDFPIRSTGLATHAAAQPCSPPSRPCQAISCWLTAVASTGSAATSSPSGKSHKRVVSRLIALPGDLVRLRGTTELLEVPEGHCWVEGDNPSQSKDSRTYGPVSTNILLCECVTIFCIVLDSQL
uniref:Mitochondrial inner membrane protease subunit 2 n=1 Tax=Aegilops tauschii subsp. strangulata TaxID=200361 RepID=A0A453GB67_AEGTS